MFAAKQYGESCLSMDYLMDFVHRKEEGRFDFPFEVLHDGQAVLYADPDRQLGFSHGEVDRECEIGGLQELLSMNKESSGQRSSRRVNPFFNILLGKAEIIHKIRTHPLYRTFRLDKISIGLMEATLEAYLDINTLPEMVPTIHMLELTSNELLAYVKSFKSKLKIKKKSDWNCEIVKTDSIPGGGALPETSIESIAIVLSNPKWSSNKLQKWFRDQTTPVIVRIHEEQIWIDFRTILPRDTSELLSIVSKLITL